MADNTGIGKAIKDGNGNALIMTAIFAAALANALPTPADSLYFEKQQVWKAQLEDGTITPKQYWIKDILNYYTFTAAWYVCVGAVLLAVGNGDYNRTAKLAILLVAGGLVVGVAQKNITKDEQIADLKKQQQDALAKKLGVSASTLSATPVAACAPPVPAVCNVNFKTNS